MPYWIKMFFLALLVGIGDRSLSQPFANEIAAFKRQDEIAFPPKQAILFVGSSSFNYWKKMATSFPNHKVINRGFGGSSIPDVIQYANEIIFPYSPRQIVIYCGENDIASSKNITGRIVKNRFVSLFTLLRAELPEVSIVFISLKPSPARWEMRGRMQEANKHIKKFLRKKKNTCYISVWKAMLDEKGTPKEEIFGPDHLHMNDKGYAIWKSIIEPYLLAQEKALE